MIRPICCFPLAIVLLGFVANPAMGETITLKTNLFRYEISSGGTSAGLIDLRDGENYLDSEPAPVAILVQGGSRHEASGVRLEGDCLHVSFADTDAKAVIRVEQKPDWLVFELQELSDNHDVEEVVFLNVCVSIQARNVAVQAGCVGSDRFTVGCQALNLQTNSQLQLAGRPVFLMGRCYRRFGLVGARAALFAAPNERLLQVIEAIEIAEPQVPHSTLDGTWARVSPDGRESYLFIDMTEANADEVIRIAQELNFGYIMTYAPTWARTRGSYEINTNHFPLGEAGLRSVAEKAHAAGLKFGIHCLTGFVSKSDPLVSPVPDRRLSKDGSVTLAADIDEMADFIPTVESPQGFPDDVGFGHDVQGFDVQIDDEIIGYRGLATQPPYGFVRCQRGICGTKAAAHKKGATAWHLTQRYAHYLADCDTDLADQIAGRYAELINDCQLDMIYFDGAGANVAFGSQWGWRYIPWIPLLSQQIWKREVRVGGSCSGPMYWHMQSFKTCNDFVEIGVKSFFDNMKVQQGQGVRANFTPVDFGWWGLHTWAPHRRSTTPDEIEYVCQKTLAFDAFWSLETTLKTIRSCGRWPDIKRTIAQYEQLRLADHFSEEVKQAVQQTGAEFKLVEDERQGWCLAPIRYGPAQLVLDKVSRSWTVINDFGPTPLRCRIYALPMLLPYDEAENPVLIDQQDASRYVKMRASSQCDTRLDAGDQKTPAGEACVDFAARSQLSDDTGWCEHRADLVQPGGRAVRTALIEGLPEEITTTNRWARALGVWVHGDGKGEVLNIQLRAANGGYRDHYVDIDFTGWRYCELTRPESDRVFEFDAGYSTKHTVRHFQYDRIASLFLRFNSIPPESDVRCLVGPVKALREHWLPIKDPTLAASGESIVFPCELATEQYLEYGGGGEARLFDREGVEIGRVKPKGKPPTLQEGDNLVTFSSADGPTFSDRAEVTIIRMDDARFGQR
jgi:hypothetical protein